MTIAKTICGDNFMIDIDDLIQQVKNLFNIDIVRFNTPEYEKFHNEIMQFVYERHFQNTEEWQIISENLVYKSNQCMISSEADLILVQLNRLKERVLLYNCVISWECIHPQIERVSKQLFLDGQFSNAAEDAFIEINERIKKIFHTLEPSKQIPDGRDVMNKVFADGDKAMIEVCDRSTETGNNIHEGTRFMLAGAMAALRNPKAHSNTVIITQEECVRRLMFASMLMYKIDEAIDYSGIAE